MNSHDEQAKKTTAERLNSVKEKLSLALKKANRKVGDCSLVAVSKTKGSTQIEEAIAAGQTVFGENRVQEASEKWPPLVEKHNNIKLRLIGPLQSNKVRVAVKLFDTIETLDREKLARTLARVMEEENKYPKIYIQVNTGEEPQKAGVAPAELEDFLKTVNDMGIKVEGLMCIPPQTEEPAMHFALLKKLADRHQLSGVSMGMSKDYEVAAQLGATSVRVGTDIFGSRD